MTSAQIAAFAIIGLLMAFFVWGRFRYDLVAMGGLLAGLATGIVPAEQAFTGFSDPIVVIVASALVLSAATGRSGVIEDVLRPLQKYMKTTGAQVAVFGGAVAASSAFVKNIGALAAFLPVAVQVSRRSGNPPSRLLMPMSFAALLGGMTTLIGTSPNLIVARVRAELGGAPFAMFDFAPVGIGLTLAGLAFLCVFWRLLPRGSGTGADVEPVDQSYLTEARPEADSPVIGKTVAEFEALSEGEVTLAAIVRNENQRMIPAGHWRIAAADVLVLEGEAEALKRAVDVAKLSLVGQKPPPDKDEAAAEQPGVEAAAPATEKAKRTAETAIVEAVVTEASPLVSTSLERFRLRDRHGVSVLAIRRSGRRLTQRLRRVSFRAGDVVVIEGHQDAVPGVLATLRLLPLAERNVQLGRGRQRFLPLAILGIAMAAAASHAVPVQIAFFAAAVGVVLVGALPLKDAYDSIEWPILVLLAALIPVSDALRSTGVTDLLAGAIAAGAHALPAWGALALMIVAAMAVTPFLNNAATVLIMAPVGAGFARNLGLNPDPFLMAVAVGAACDFLTPIGHQCNTLVMGPGGYAFGDYWRLGLPLSLIVIVLGTVLIALFWPLRAA